MGDDPAEAPAGHREVLREAADHDRVGRDRQGGLGPRAVGDAVVDLVGHELHTSVRAPGGERGETLAGQDGARRVRRAGHHQSVERTGRVEGLRARGPAVLWSDGDADRLDAERHQCVAVARIPGLDDRHPLARVEAGQEGEGEAGRCSCRHDDLGRVHLHAVPARVVAGDGPPQRQQPRGVGVADLIVVERSPSRFPHRGRRGRGRLADLQVDHRSAGRLPLRGQARHRHGVERRHIRP